MESECVNDRQIRSAASATNGKSCACRGIRRCALCKYLWVDGAVFSATSVEVHDYYNYCFECQKAYVCQRNSASVADHPLHLDETEEASFALGDMFIRRDFITEHEERQLVTQIDGRFWVDSQSGRRKQDYGPKVNFKRQKLHLEQFTGLPNFSRDILRRINETDGLNDFRCAELCNLEYLPQRESHIAAHVDDEWLWGERLITLNLASCSILTLTSRRPPDSGAIPVVRVPMPRRSLFVMSGASRHDWKHAIASEDIRERRLAMTFRELTPEFTSGTQKDVGEAIFRLAYTFTGDVVRPGL